MSIKLTRAEAKKLGLNGTKKARKPSPAHVWRVGKRRKPPDSTGSESVMDALCLAHGLPLPVPEYQFHPTRKWRADYAFPELDLLVEIEGGAYAVVQGRHTRGKGFENDCEKYAEAIVLGWTILRVTPEMVDDGRLFGWLRRIAGVEGGES